jgi:hypothetical protein
MAEGFVPVSEWVPLVTVKRILDRRALGFDHCLTAPGKRPKGDGWGDLPISEGPSYAIWERKAGSESTI